MESEAPPERTTDPVILEVGAYEGGRFSDGHLSEGLHKGLSYRLGHFLTRTSSSFLSSRIEGQGLVHEGLQLSRERIAGIQLVHPCFPCTPAVDNAPELKSFQLFPDRVEVGLEEPCNLPGIYPSPLACRKTRTRSRLIDPSKDSSM
jgi:hypothetical protein